MGRAGAGAEAGVDNASASLYNPASMTRLQGKQFMATGGLIWTQTEFDVERSSILHGTNDGGDAGGLAPAISAFYTQPINERWRYGVNFYALTGSALDYDDSWAGRYQATDVELVLLALQPTVAFKVNDKLSIGAGLVLGYTALELTVATPNLNTPLAGPDGEAVLDGDDFVVGYSLGAMISLSPQTRLGITYQSEMEPSYSGDVKLSPSNAQVGVDTELPLAAFLRVGMTHAFNDRWQGHVTIGWEDWDTLDALILSTESGGAVLDRNWDDTYHYAAGVTHKLDETWSVQAGISYDTNPADKEFRTADLPLDRQIRYAFGAKHVRPSGLEIAGHLVYADYGSAKIDSRGFAGEYKSNDILFVSVSFNWRLQ
jgi:long-chain fatty acid transport protein